MPLKQKNLKISLGGLARWKIVAQSSKMAHWVEFAWNTYRLFQEMIEVRPPLTAIAATPRVDHTDTKFTFNNFPSKVSESCLPLQITVNANY